jgi:DNA-binding transcriptional ArsR family regulator
MFRVEAKHVGLWQVNADTMASGKFVISPLAEAVACLMVLAKSVAAHPAERAWLELHLPEYRARLARDPVTASLVIAALGNRRWISDFLTPTPASEGNRTFSEELAEVRATPAQTVHEDLRVALGGPLPDRLNRSDLAECMADLLEWVWTRTVLPSWSRRMRILEADVVARTRQLSQGGWAAALNEMRPEMRWLGDGRLQINAYDYPPREISGAQLLFVPVTPRMGWVTEDEPHRYAVIYPCSAPLADADRPPVPEALARLLGPGRAHILLLLETPVSTTQLVALTGLGLGSVGRHLKVLLDAGLVQRRRVGRSVLYYRSQAGNVTAGASVGAHGIGGLNPPNDRAG